MQALVEILSKFGSPRVLLVGDLMLDRYVYGNVERINPEAPVPVLQTVRRESRIGGAGNVAAAVTALGGGVHCVGVIGKDAAGEELASLLSAAGTRTTGLIRLGERPTAVKTRYVGLAQHRSPQQMLRVDEESVEPLPEHMQNTMRSAVRAELGGANIVALEDYNKGVLTDELTPMLIADARKAGKCVIADPACIPDYRRYRGATLLKPNRYEASLASGMKIAGDADLAEASRRLLDIAEADAILITLDREGAYLYRRDAKTGVRIPHRRPRSVYDVSGAGDVTLAVLAVAVAEGCSYEQAAELANVAGGLEVERFGIVPIRRQEIADELHRMIGLRVDKTLERNKLAEELARRRREGETVVFTNGCFDLLHLGHVHYLQQARELGSCLVVAINSDASVRRLKGESRPVIGQNERAGMLAALECVDYVTIFDEDTPRELLELLRPEILAKGGTTPVVVGREIVEGYGGKVMTLDKVDGLSTTDIIRRITGGES
jgi:D-beta-D-heptose 7-phosphate kinase/D-beta-D-heptose 1-phosphate adenosyltransferase